MSEQPLHLAELVRRALDDRLADVHTSAPGTVVSFNATDYTVDVRLGYNRPTKAWDGTVVYEEPPVIPGIPVACFGTERTYLKSDLAPGDKVWLIFSEVSPAEFLDSGSVSNPGDTARHSMSGALAIPFVLPTKLGSTPVVLGGAGGDFVALAGAVMSNLSALSAAITAATVGGVPVAWVPPAFQAVAATTTKAK